MYVLQEQVMLKQYTKMWIYCMLNSSCSYPVSYVYTYVLAMYNRLFSQTTGGGTNYHE